MVIQQNYRETETIGEEMETSKMHVSREAENHLIRMATEWSYKSPLESGLREAVSNAIDSHLEAGNDSPIIVRLGKNKTNNWVLEIIDEGLGLDNVGFDKYIMGIGESTKRNNPKLLGGYGAGAKAFISYVDSYEYICRKEGIERKYVIMKGEEIPERIMVYEKGTEEKNGVKVSVTLQQNWGEENNCERAIQEQLGYLDNVYFDIPGFDNTYQIHRNPLFEWNTLHTYNELHISLKGIYYPINWSKLNISRIYVPIALKFDDYDLLQPVFNREELIWNSKSREGVIQKIKEVANWFQEKYDLDVKEFDNFPLAFKHLRETEKFVELSGQKFKINELEPYMSKPCKSIEVKGIKIETPHHYFAHLDRICKNFKCVGNTNYNGTYQSKNVYQTVKQYINWDREAILLDQHPVGRVKTYLKEKYSSYKYFFLEHAPSLELYEQALILKKYPKNEWRNRILEIQELHKQIRENYFIDERGVKDSKEFLDWVEEQKELAKANKAAGIESSYKVLDKQEGEVTIAYSRDAILGTEPVFEKKTYDIHGIKKDGYVSILFSEEDKEIAKKYHNLHKNLKTGIIGKRERTKLPETHQIMNKEQFEKTKLFKRIATAMRIDIGLQRWEKINRKEEIVNDCLDKFKDLKKKLWVYREDNLSRIGLSQEECESFMLLAEEHNLWDQEILPDIKEFEKNIDTFYFLQYIEYPRYASMEDTRRVKRIINQLLLFQKKHGHLDNYELTEKPIPDEMLQEQYELEEEFLDSPQAEELLTI